MTYCLYTVPKMENGSMGSFSSPPPNRPACVGDGHGESPCRAADTASFGTLFSRSQQEHTTALGSVDVPRSVPD